MAELRAGQRAEKLDRLLDDINADARLRRAIRRSQKLYHADGVLAGLRAGMGPGAVFVDCGAHHGETTLAVASSGATVHAFEPDPRNWERLVETCGHLPNVTLHHAAVATEEGEITIYGSARFAGREDARLSGSSIMADNTAADPSDAHSVKAVALLPFLRGLIARHGRINALKIDIEGAEVPVLEQLVATDIFQHINLTLVETHRWLFPNLRKNYTALYEFARANPGLNINLHWI